MILLAAGEGKRLLPYTNYKPKCLVPLVEKPLLERHLNVLRASGLTDIVVVTGHHSDQLESLGLNTVKNERYSTTNMVHSLMCAKDLLRSSDAVLIAYADILYEPRVLHAICNCDSDFCTSVDLNWRALWEARMTSPLSDAETLKIDGSGYIYEIGEKPTYLNEIEAQYMGLIKLRGAMGNRIVDFYESLDPLGDYNGANPENMYMTSLLQGLLAVGNKLKAVEVSGGWLEVDTTEDLARYEAMEASGHLLEFIDLSFTE